SGTLNFAAGQEANSFDIPILDDQVADGDKTVNITLTNPTAGFAQLGTPATSVVTIVDDDSAYQFSQAIYNFSRDAKSGVITINRTGDTSATVTMQFTAVAGTATPGVDYNIADQVVTFNPGEVQKNISFTIPDDPIVVEPDRAFTVLLTNIN